MNPIKKPTEAQQTLENYEDLQALRAAKKSEQNAPTMSLAEVKEKLGIGKPYSKRNR